MSYNEYSSCTLCPRECRADRSGGERGFCGEGDNLRVGRADLHQWEEPCISGKNGSGTVFFSGCPLRCCYCQNYNLSRGEEGVGISTEKLSDIFLNLKNRGAHNINLVTAEHFAPHVRDAVISARQKGLDIPVILNSSGYVSLKTLEILGNCIDIFLVDFKYMDTALAKKYSLAEDYPSVVKKALARMVEMAGKPLFDEDGLLKKGVLVRHLCLPGCTEDSVEVIKYVFETYADNVGLSIMNQYTPNHHCTKFPNLTRTLSKKEYAWVIDQCINMGVEDAYIQEGGAASESFIPSFDGYGVI